MWMKGQAPLCVMLFVGFWLCGVSGAFAEHSLSNVLVQLGAESYEDRERASEALLGVLREDPTRVVDVRARYQSTDDPEVQHRILQAVLSGVSESVLNPPRGALGLSYFKCEEEMSDGKRIPGFRISSAVSGRAADLAGLKAGDLVIAFGNWRLSEASLVKEIPAFMTTRYEGQALRLRVISEGEVRDVDTVLTRRFGHREWSASEFRSQMLRWLMSTDELPGRPR